MAEDKKTKKEKPIEKIEAKPAEKTGAKPEAKTEVPAEAKSEAPKNYSIGEGQKAVTKAYKDNWNAIFGKKKR